MEVVCQVTNTTSSRPSTAFFNQVLFCAVRIASSSVVSCQLSVALHNLLTAPIPVPVPSCRMGIHVWAHAPRTGRTTLFESMPESASGTVGHHQRLRTGRESSVRPRTQDPGLGVDMQDR